MLLRQLISRLLRMRLETFILQFILNTEGEENLFGQLVHHAE